MRPATASLTLLEHAETFLAENTVPAFVARTFRRFMDCGMLPKCFLRVVCSTRKHESLVAFSCKDRGVCPSCTARRAAQTAAHLVDEVIPHVPVRQFVLAMPFDLHHRLARDAELEGKVLAIFIDELQQHLRMATEATNEARTGTFSGTQHFGSALNLLAFVPTLRVRVVSIGASSGRRRVGEDGHAPHSRTA